MGIGMIGCGTVGSGVVRLLEEMAQTYTARTGVRLVLKRVLVRDLQRSDRPTSLGNDVLTDDADAFFATADMPIVIEVAGSTAMKQHI